MIDGRRALMRVAEQFFRDELLGHYRIDDAEIFPAKLVERRPGAPREQGKFHDCLAMRFGPFTLSVFGPDEPDELGIVRPLGWATLRDDFAHEQGTFDPATWRRFGAFIRERKQDYERSSGAGRGGW